MTWQATTQFRCYKFWKATRRSDGSIAEWNAQRDGVLQQLWRCLEDGKTEWRDVPLVEEYEQ